MKGDHSGHPDEKGDRGVPRPLMLKLPPFLGYSQKGPLQCRYFFFVHIPVGCAFPEDSHIKY